MLCCSLLFHSLAFSLFALSLFCYFALVALYLKSKGTNRSHCTLEKKQIPNPLIIDLNCFSLEYESLFALCKRAKKVICFCRSLQKSNLLSSLFTKGASTLHKKLKSKFSTPIINKIREKNTSGHLSISFLQNNSGQLSISFLEINSSGQLSISMQEKNNLGQLSKGLGLRSFALLLFALSLFSYFALCSFPLLLFCSCRSILKEQMGQIALIALREKIIIYVENLFTTFLVIFVSTFSLYYFLILQFMVPRRKAHRKLSP